MHTGTLPHSVMFHHFHGNGHGHGQGSISAEELTEILDWLKKKYNILGAYDFQVAALSDTLQPNDICLSFDDALLCQFDIALPVLKSYDITAFFFIYSAPLCGEENYLEIFRDFRNTFFKNIDDFYDHFFKLVEAKFNIDYHQSLAAFLDSGYLVDYPFYSQNDRWFRFLRDVVLGPEQYHEIMIKMLNAYSYDIAKASERLWISESHIGHLHQNGHVIGLHSYSHPTAISRLSRSEQMQEYKRNKDHLCKILRTSEISSVSHPCGDYNSETLSVLKELDVKIGFNSSMTPVTGSGLLELPREDHSNVLKQVSK